MLSHYYSKISTDGLNCFENDDNNQRKDNDSEKKIYTENKNNDNDNTTIMILIIIGEWILHMIMRTKAKW